MKPFNLRNSESLAVVAPYAGAWIETASPAFATTPKLVAPYAGAWIETMFHGNRCSVTRCRPLRGGVD